MILRDTSRKLLLRAVGMLLLCVLTSGCSDSKVGQVTGRVTYEGKPVARLEIEFDPVERGRGSIGFTDENGEYEMQYTLQERGALLGKHTVRVKIPPETDLGFEVPAQYGSRSALVYDVQPGSNEFDIDMTKWAGK